MHQPEIIVLLFAAVTALGGGRGQACAAMSDRARHNRTCIELRSAPAGSETQSLSPAYSGNERARMILSDRALGQNCFASQGRIGLFLKVLPVFSNRVFQIWTLVAPSTRS
jgi:hypothetical protein